MRKIGIVALALLGFQHLWGMLPLTNRVTVVMSKPDVRLESVPPIWLERRRKALGAQEIRVGTDTLGIPYVTIVAKTVEKPSRIQTSVDLSVWFTQKSSLKDWKTFHRCINEKNESPDAFIYRTIDKEFVAKLVCEEGGKCIDPSFVFWRVRWLTPSYIQLEAQIGQGGFVSLEAAKKSLHKINALLKKSLYGAHFPEDFGEGRTPYEVFSIDSVRIENFPFAQALAKLLRRLMVSGFLKGLEDADIEAITKKAQGGKTIYYLPSRCAGGQAQGWFAITNGSRIRFDLRHCPHLEILR